MTKSDPWVVFQRILRRLTDPAVKDKIAKDSYFKAYAITNEYEFMAVITEYFFESLQIFKIEFPVLYGHTKTLLNFNFVND